MRAPATQHLDDLDPLPLGATDSSSTGCGDRREAELGGLGRDLSLDLGGRRGSETPTRIGEQMFSSAVNGITSLKC